MVANIFGDAFLGRAPAWHRVGTVIGDREITAEAGLDEIGANYQIVKQPLKVEIAPGQLASIDNRFALMREPAQGQTDWECLGIVGKDYEYVQNIDVAKMVDSITAQTGWKVETIGVIGKGETIFYTLDAGMSKIAGEDTKLFYLVNENRGNGRALRIAFTPVTVVCENTLMAGLSSAVVNAAMFHGKSLKNELEWRATTIAQMKKAQDETIKKIDALKTKKLVDDQIDDILRRVYVEPREAKKVALKNGLMEFAPDAMTEALSKSLDDAEKSSANWKARLDAFRTAAKDRYVAFGDEDWGEGTKARRKVAGTAYALYSAVVETEDYRKGPASDSAIFGFRAQNKARAFQVLQALPA